MDYAQIDTSRLYNHVLNLQGVRHALTNPENLKEAADYIKNEFEKLGMEVIEEVFNIEGSDFDFRNIVGVLKKGEADEIVISGHHDSVYNAPGANDNATACATVLECARICKEQINSLPENIHLRFVTFDQEETNPVLEKKMWDLGEKHGIRERMTFTELRYRENHIKLLPYLIKLRTVEDRNNFLEEIRDADITDNERAYFGELVDLANLMFKDTWIGVTALMGSSHYVKMAKKENRTIRAIINLDTIGCTSINKGSQTFPIGYPVKLLKLIAKGIPIPKLSSVFKFQGVKDVTVGDFAYLIADSNSTSIGKQFLNHSKTVNLKTGAVMVPMDFEEIQEKMPDILRSDHTPFWMGDIPGIFITDTANFRYPHYHTESDRIEFVDFEFVRKITQATLLTAIGIADN